MGLSLKRCKLPKIFIPGLHSSILWYRFNQVFIAPFCYCSGLWGALDCSFSRCCGALCTALDGSFSWWFLLTSCLAPCCCKEHLQGLAFFLWLSTRLYMIWQCLNFLYFIFLKHPSLTTFYIIYKNVNIYYIYTIVSAQKKKTYIYNIVYFPS